MGKENKIIPACNWPKSCSDCVGSDSLLCPMVEKHLIRMRDNTDHLVYEKVENKIVSVYSNFSPDISIRQQIEDMIGLLVKLRHVAPLEYRTHYFPDSGCRKIHPKPNSDGQYE